MILLNCEHATARMTDLVEGGLPWPKHLALRTHLILCRGCRDFLRGLRAVPKLAREMLREPEAAPAVGCASLDAVLAKLVAGEARGPHSHPSPAHWEAVEAGRVDFPTRLILETHLGACAACRAAHPALPAHAPALARGERTDSDQPLPPEILAQLPPPATWAWRRRLLNGSRAARVWEDGSTSLWLTFVAPGRAFPSHRHHGAETSVLLSGWVREGLELAGPGDFIHREPGSEHAPETNGNDGCWVLSRVGEGGIRFQGWRRMLS